MTEKTPAFQHQHLPCAAPCTSLFVHSGPRHGSRTPGHGCLHTTTCALCQSTREPCPSVRLTGWHAPAHTRQMNWTDSCERTLIRDDLVLVTIFTVFFSRNVSTSNKATGLKNAAQQLFYKTKITSNKGRVWINPQCFTAKFNNFSCFRYRRYSTTGLFFPPRPRTTLQWCCVKWTLSRSTFLPAGFVGEENALYV